MDDVALEAQTAPESAEILSPQTPPPESPGLIRRPPAPAGPVRLARPGAADLSRGNPSAELRALTEGPIGAAVAVAASDADSISEATRKAYRREPRGQRAARPGRRYRLPPPSGAASPSADAPSDPEDAWRHPTAPSSPGPPGWLRSPRPTSSTRWTSARATSPVQRAWPGFGIGRCSGCFAGALCRAGRVANERDHLRFEARAWLS